jgi:hypothetical protein
MVMKKWASVAAESRQNYGKSHFEFAVTLL